MSRIYHKVLKFFFVFMLAACCVPARAASAGGPVWARLDLVENSAEGPAYNRCEVEATLEAGRTTNWRVFFGEARVDSSSGWAAIRSGSGCAPASDGAPIRWTVRGSPYFLVDVSLVQATVSGHEILIETSFSIQKLTGFSQSGAPAYETRTEKRTLRVPDGGSEEVPILVASQRETDEFQVRELLLKFRASAIGARPRLDYGEISVAADVPRADIFLDGGLVGRTSSEGPVILAAVRVGEREIVVRDASGREARARAKVEEGGRTSVSLSLLKDVSAASDGLRPLGRNPQGIEEYWREKDSAIVVRIPGGEFQMGSPGGTGQPPEHPQHAVRVNGFLMDKTEVTWGQYRQFVKESNRPLPKLPIYGMREELPVSNVTWNDASAFCAWAGGRLPTEAEWERAAAGDDARRYPWGNNWEPWRCNARDGGPHGPTPAGAYPDCVAPFGVLDLTGSVREWCSDWYDETYYAQSPVDNPKGPATGKMRVSRGGEWMTAFTWSRSAFRQGFDQLWQSATQGFRCVQEDTKAAVAAASPMFLAAQSSATGPSTKFELRVETLTNREDAPVAPCGVVQAKPGSAFVHYISFDSWSALGDAGHSEKAGFELRSKAGRCGVGHFPAVSPGPLGTTSAPFLVQEISAMVGWHPGTMDPGAVPAAQISLTVSSRRLSGFSPDGKPVYTELGTDRRTIRLEEGEEFVLPVSAANAQARETLGIDEVLLRLRAGWAGRPGATEYGALAVMAAVPGSEILLDGGVAGHVGADGSFLLRNVPVGLREVRIRGASGPIMSRWVSVVKGRTVALSPGAAGSGVASQPFATSAAKNEQGFKEYRRTRDGAIMVQIPEGEFLMGNLETEGHPLPHTVYVSSFLMDKLPVTVGQFKRFAEATGNPLPPDPYWGVHDNFPVAFVRWDEAKAYCEWTGGRLPTEAEREKATRGTDGRMWPWGSEPPSPERGVFFRRWGELGNDAVGIRPEGASPYGLLDTGGNMWEYCEDWWDSDYFKVSPKKDPPGPKTGQARVVKGGSWDSRPAVLSASCRNFAYTGYREGDFGFRCAADSAR